MAKKIEKIIIPFSFEEEKGSLNKIKTSLTELQKSLLGNVGKGFVNSLVPEVNEAIKKVNKAMAQINKPVYSNKEATAIGKNITTSIEDVNKIIRNIPSKLGAIWDPKAAAAANAEIQESGDELERLYEIRDKWTKLNSRQRQTGNETKLRSELLDVEEKIAVYREKDTHTEEEIKDLEKLISREQEITNILDEKKKIKEDMAKLAQETNYNDVSSVDRDIQEYSMINDDATHRTLLTVDYAKITDGLKTVISLVNNLTSSTANLGEEAGNTYNDTLQGLKENELQAKELKQTIGDLIGIDISLRGLTTAFKQLIRVSFDFYKSLDQALTDISIVSDMSRGQVQGLTQEFIKLSAQTGMAIDDIAQASVIFFQQGLSKDAVMEMTEVTAQFAKVAGSTVEKAADQLTAAINGYRVGVEGAIDVADKLNAVAAKSAASIDEISTAMEKGAAQANQAGISMDKYFATIATMEEVTREAPENIGTSLKTIMARMQQIKSGENTEDDVDVNDVETALKTVGIALRDDTGQLKALDDVLNELGPKWNLLDRNTQAYLGTVIAGTRQQSRFISLMQNWDRVLELTEVSQESAGQQALMHEKAMEGLGAAINTLTNSWQKFLTTLTNSDAFIGILNTLSKVMNNLTKSGATSKIVMAALTITLQKNSDRFAKLAMSINKAYINMKTYGDQAKKGTSIFKGLKKQSDQYIDDLRKAQKAYKENCTELSKLNVIQSQRNGYLKIGSEQISTSIEDLRKEADAITNSTLSSEQQEIALSELAAKYGLTKDALEQLIMSDERFAETMNKTTEAVNTSGQVLEETLKATDQAMATSSFIITAIQTISTALGAADSAWVDFGIAAVAAITLIEFGFKKADKELSTNPLYWILKFGAIALSGIVAVINLFKKIGSDGKEELSKLREEQEKLGDSLSTTATKMKTLNDYMETYNKLSKKIALTTDEQEKLNEAIQGMGDLTGTEVYKDSQGNSYINMEEVDKWMNEQQKQYAEQLDEYRQKTSETLDQTAKVLFKEQKSGWKTAFNWLSDMTLLLNPMTVIPGIIKSISDINDTKEKKMEARLKAFEESEYDLLDTMVNVVENVADKDEFGNVLAEATDKADLQEDVKKAILEGFKEEYVKGKIDSEELLELANKKAEEYNEFFTKGAGKNAYTQVSAQLGQLKKTTETKTYTEIQNEVDNLFNELTAGLDRNTENYIALMKLKKAEMDSIWANSGFNIEELITKYSDGSDLSNKITEILKNSNVNMVSTFNDIGLFNGVEESNIILQQLTQENIDNINKAYQESSAEGSKVLVETLANISAKLEESGTDDKVISYIYNMMKKVKATMSSVSFVDWGNDIKKAADPIATINSALDELNESGTMTWGTFENLLELFDQLSTELSGDQLNKFADAIAKMDFNIDKNTGNIIANIGAMKDMKDITIGLAKVKLQTTKDGIDNAIKENEAALKQYETDKAVAKANLERLKAGAEGSKAVCEVNRQVANDNITTAKSEAEARTSIQAQMWNSINDINRRGQKGEMTLPTPSEIKVNISKSKQTNWISGTPVSNADAEISKLEKDIENYDAAITDLKNRIKIQKSLSASLDSMIKKDWSNFGRGSKSSTKDSIEKYISQLEELLDLLTHIEVEENKLATLQAIREKQTGKASVDNLKRQIELTEHLQEDYLEAFNRQKESVKNLKDSINGMYGKVVTFNDDGSIKIDEKKYDKLSDKQKEQLDELISEYKDATETAQEYYSKTIENLQNEIDMRQELIDEYIEAENELVEAIKNRERKILDAKLAAIDKEIDAIQKLADARRKAREEEDDAEELSSLQTDLQRAMMDSSGASASQILQIQKQIKDKQQEMADNSFDDMVDDLTQQLEDEKEAEQKLFDERLEEMDWYWNEVDRIMSEGIDSVMETMKLYSEEYNQLSEVQQTEMLNGWKDTFGRAEEIGKTSAQNMQKIIIGIRDAFNALEAEDVERALNLLNGINLTAEEMGIKSEGIPLTGYARGGMNYTTGPAWLDGTASNPEAVLNAVQTKAFLQFADDLAALRAEGAGLNSNILIDTISFNVDSMSSVQDGEIAFNAFVDKFKEIGAKTGISIRGTSNQL